MTRNAAFVVSSAILVLVCALFLAAVEALHHTLWAAVLHAGAAACVVALASWYRLRSAWPAGAASLLALANGAVTGYMRMLCIIGCVPRSPVPSMVRWVLIDLAISALIFGLWFVARRPPESRAARERLQ